MRGIKLSVLLLCAVFILCACGKAVPEADGTNEVLTDLSGYEDSFVLGTDDQPDRSTDWTDAAYTAAYTEDGYYFTENEYTIERGSGFVLWYHDYASGEEIRVCGKTDCDHESDADCDAFFKESQYPISSEQLWYYEGALYHFCLDEDYYAIEKVSMDGSQRSISCRLYRTSIEQEMDDDGTLIESTTYYPSIILHRGYAYFCTVSTAGEPCSLYRVKLDSSEKAELLYTQEGNDPTIYRLKGYGNGVFFQMGDFFNEDLTEFDISLYVYDIETGTISLVADDVIRNYTVGNGGIYYMDFENRDSLMKYTPATQETVMLMDSQGTEAEYGLCIFAQDGYLYYTLPYGQTVYDDGGNVVQVLEGDDMVMPYGG